MATSEAVLLDDKRAAADRATLQELVNQLVIVMKPLQWPGTERVHVTAPRWTSTFWLKRYRKGRAFSSIETTRMAWMITPPPSEDDVFEDTEVGITTEGETVEAWMTMYGFGGILPSQRLGSPNAYGDPRRVQALIGLVQGLLAKYDA